MQTLLGLKRGGPGEAFHWEAQPRQTLLVLKPRRPGEKPGGSGEELH